MPPRHDGHESDRIRSTYTNLRLPCGTLFAVDTADVLGGRYRLVERLGEGGMSVIWRARDEVLGRDVAVKVLSARLAGDPSSRQRIWAEAQAVARLAHPNIAGVFDCGESGFGASGERVPYIVMELLTGSTLTELLEDRPMPLHWVLRVGAEVAAALAAAHRQGIVHRDVKPANVMVTAGGVAKVVDFGVAGVVGELGEADSVLFGTPAYVAPERLQGGPVAAGTDLYGFGVLMYRMLAGHMPWPAESTTEMLVAHLHLEPDPLPPLTGLPADVVEICAACLAKDPADRPAAADVAATLAAAAAAHAPPAAGARTAGPPAGARRNSGVRPGTAAPAAGRARRRRQLATAGAALLVIATAVAAASGGPGGTPSAGSPPIGATGGATATSPAVGGIGVADPPVGTAAPPPDAGPGGLAPNQVDPRPADPPPVTGGGTVQAPDPVTPTPDPPAAVERSASLAGNSVTVRCVGATATIIGATPAADWSISRIRPGPADQVNVKFESATVAPNRVTFKSRCHDGIPRINPDTAE
jgi:eukaryotic-like serine/threonine-protein kinase